MLLIKSNTATMPTGFNGRSEVGASVVPALNLTLKTIAIDQETADIICPEFGDTFFDEDGERRCQDAYPIEPRGEFQGDLTIADRKFDKVNFCKFKMTPLANAEVAVEFQAQIHPKEGDADFLMALFRKKMVSVKVDAAVTDNGGQMDFEDDDDED